MKGFAACCVILFIVTIFNLTYNPDTAAGFGFGSLNFAQIADDTLYDVSGHAVCYTNGSAIGEDGAMSTGIGMIGILSLNPSIVGGENCDYLWQNETNPNYGVNADYFNLVPEFIGDYYALYDNPYGGAFNNNLFYNFFLGSQLGFLSIVGIVMTVSLIVGIRVFGSGTSEFSVAMFIKGAAYIGIFMALSAYSYGMILSVPYGFGVLFYFALTGIACLSILGSVQHGGGAD